MLLGQTPVLTRQRSYWVEEETELNWICNEELEKLTGKCFPYRIRVLLFDRSSKNRHAIVINNSGDVLHWFDDRVTYLTEINRWRPFLWTLDRRLIKILPLGIHKLFFQVKGA